MSFEAEESAHRLSRRCVLSFQAAAGKSLFALTMVINKLSVRPRDSKAAGTRSAIGPSGNNVLPNVL